MRVGLRGSETCTSCCWVDVLTHRNWHATNLVHDRYFLEIFALQDLIEGAPETLCRFAGHFDVEATNKLEVLHAKEGERVQLLDLYVQWSWFSSSIDIVTDMADSMLFHCMGGYFQDTSKLEDQEALKKQREAQPGAVYSFESPGSSEIESDHCETVQTPQGVAQPGEPHQRSLAQSLNSRYWKGALQIVRSKEFAPTNNGIVPETKLYHLDQLDLPPDLLLTVQDHLQHRYSRRLPLLKQNKISFGATDNSRPEPSPPHPHNFAKSDEYIVVEEQLMHHTASNPPGTANPAVVRREGWSAVNVPTANARMNEHEERNRSILERLRHGLF